MSELIDNRAHRVRTLKQIIKRLQAGGNPDDVRHDLRGLVTSVDSTEIAAMEQELMAEGMPVEESCSAASTKRCVWRTQTSRNCSSWRAPWANPARPL